MKKKLQASRAEIEIRHLVVVFIVKRTRLRCVVEFGLVYERKLAGNSKNARKSKWPRQTDLFCFMIGPDFYNLI